MSWKIELKKSLILNRRKNERERQMTFLRTLWDNIKHTNIHIIRVP